MIRRGFMFLSVLSLVTCLALGALWVWSYRSLLGAGRRVERDRTAYVLAGVSRGRAACIEVHGSSDHDPAWVGPSGWGVDRQPPSDLIEDRNTFWGRLGFEYDEESFGSPGSAFWFTYRRVVFPIWLPTALAAVAPAAWLIAARRRRARQRRNEAHRCATCAYDLTGNVSGTCPECGMLVAVKK